jgi:hypothetical protein
MGLAFRPRAGSVLGTPWSYELSGVRIGRIFAPSLDMAAIQDVG